MENEKLSINLPPVELGKIDILVSQGLFASRTDLIRTAIRSLLEAHSDEVEHVRHGATGIGHLHLSREGLEAARRKREKRTYVFLGVVTIDPSVTPELAAATIHSIRVYGSLRASKEVMEALGPAIKRGLVLTVR